MNNICVRRLVADSEDIIHTHFIFSKGPSIGYVTNENIERVCRIHAKLLHQLDGAFSLLRKIDPTHEKIREAGDFFYASMEICYKLGLSVTPKAHIFEDHSVESM